MVGVVLSICCGRLNFGYTKSQLIFVSARQIASIPSCSIVLLSFLYFQLQLEFPDSGMPSAFSNSILKVLLFLDTNLSPKTGISDNLYLFCCDDFDCDDEFDVGFQGLA